MLESLQRSSSVHLGVDIGGTKCAVVLGDGQGNIVGRLEQATSDELGYWPEAGKTLSAMITHLCSNSNIKTSALTSVGVSCGGPLNSRTGRILNPPNLPGWDDADIVSYLTSELGVDRVFLENDANATAIAEHRWGAGIDVPNLAYLTCGTGIGAGIILEGKIYRGKNDLAGEIGHAVVVPGGTLCLCGKRGCLEALASGSAIGRIGAERFCRPGMSGKSVIELAKSGNTAARDIIQSAAYYLGIGIANLLQTLDLNMVIIGSLAAYAGELYMDTVRATVRENTWSAVLSSVQIVNSGLGDRTQDFAALAVAMPMEY
jgi:glucokinase